ncbi:hypothetical protein [Streptomyces sp. NPDC051173]|uniref:hypothetical protein n=1 Tax=Streptomyces sp. NPDC051173 TaxID=3155164 RepID=UPI00344E9170
MKARWAGVAALLLTLACLLPPAARAAADGPALRLDRSEAGKGATLTVSGTGWRPRTLLTLLICGQDMIGGTDTCANADGRTVTTGGDGRFGTRIPVAEPPRPCPCVVHVATVTGDPVAVDAVLKVAGHPVASLPPRTGGERLGVLDARLEGSSGLLTWFGAPPHRRLVVTLGNLGSTPAKDPVLELGTAHGVLAPEWEKQRWRGTIAAGARARVPLDVELAAGAYGDYQVSLKYGDKVLVEEPWAVGRPWGVTLFWILLCVVVPVGVFRLGMAVVGRVRPRERSGGAGDGSLPWFRPEADPSRAAEAPGGGARHRSTTRAKARPPDGA